MDWWKQMSIKENLKELLVELIDNMDEEDLRDNLGIKEEKKNDKINNKRKKKIGYEKIRSQI